MEKLYIYGCSGHALVCFDIAKKYGYKNIEFIDDFKENYKSFDDVKENNDIPFFVAIGDNKIREKIFLNLKKYDFKIISLIDPSAIIAESVELGQGVVIMPNVVVNSKTKIGEGVILNTSCVVEHENDIEAFVHISPSVALAGNVKVKRNTHIGIGSCSIQGKIIGENSVIGAGSVIVSDLPNNVKAFGNPCKVIEEL